MIKPTQSLSKDILAHWSVISLLLLIALIFLSLPKSTPKRSNSTLPIATSSFIEVNNSNITNLLPSAIKTTLGPEFSTIAITTAAIDTPIPSVSEFYLDECNALLPLPTNSVSIIKQ